MLKNLTVFGQQPASIAGFTFPVGNGLVGVGADINNSAIQIKDISGLGPVKASIGTSGYAGLPGNRFNGSSVGSRNIVIKVGLNPNWTTQTMESLRQELYRILMPEQPVRLLFTSSHIPDVDIDGYVEDFVEDMFSKDPEMQISIICPYPHFKAVDDTVITGESIATGGAHTIAEYEGTIKTGFEFLIANATPNYTGPFELVVGFTLATFPVPQFFSELFELSSVPLDATHGFKAITIPGQKAVYKYAGGVGNSLLSVMTTAVWPMLRPGTNEIIVFTNEVTGIDWSITYNALYGGL